MKNYIATVIIVNWNSGNLLKKTLKSLKKQTFKNFQTIIIDNNSSDKSAFISQDFMSDPTTVLFMKENTGFARANNFSLQKIETPYAILLNPDAFPEKQWLEKLISRAETQSKYAAFGSRQLVENESNIIDGIGDSYHFSGLAWRDAHGEKEDDHLIKSKDIFSPCAAAALYRLSALKEIGFFDEDFFCYFEDVDLGFRLRLAGYKAMYVSDAIVHHVGSATTGGRGSDFSVYYGHRNLVWTYIKNMPPLLFWILLPSHILLNIFTIIWFSIHGQGKVIIRSKWDAIKGIPKAWKKRKKIQQERKATTLKIWKSLNKKPF